MMITRIVKMTFKPECIDTFKAHFEVHKLQIRHFEGNEYLVLYQDAQNNNILFTYSFWKSHEALNLYRNSDLFKKVWAETKVMFDDKPEAWSLNEIVSLP